MYCRFCGTQIPDNVKFCPSCGKRLTMDEAPSTAAPTNEPAPVTPESTPVWTPAAPESAAPTWAPAADTPSPAPVSAQPDVPQRGMKWFKFIIYFQLWVALLSSLITSGRFFYGWGYEGNAELVYSLWPALKIIDILMGILNLALGVYAVFVQRALAKFRTKGPRMYYIFYGASIVFSLLYALAASIIIGESAFTADVISSLVVGVVLLLVNVQYFGNRSHLFVNP